MRGLLIGLILGFSLPIVMVSHTSFGAEKELGPFPVVSSIEDTSGVVVANLHLFPHYAELFNLSGHQIGKAGILFERGLPVIEIQSLSNATDPKIKAKSFQSIVVDVTRDPLGAFARFGPYVQSFGTKNEYLGRTKCILEWEICGALATGFLLKLVP